MSKSFGKALIVLAYSWPCNNVLVQALDELLLHHTVEGSVGQVRDEGVASSSADAFTASEVQQSQRGETLQVGQTAVSQLTTTWRDVQTDRSQELHCFLGSSI